MNKTKVDELEKLEKLVVEFLQKTITHIVKSLLITKKLELLKM
ncbi:hypothetical protein IEQ_04965 [Bacillus cereus BAG6X1-2]|nr:hypothetical protein IEQ_04965 [Bacillus cereus BAG6X1-2]